MVQTAVWVIFPSRRPTKNTTRMPVTRRTVGGSCWAKAESVSHDAKRVFGGKSNSTWLKGTVLEVVAKRAEGAKRSVNYIKARYMVGNEEKIKVLSLQVLKGKDPTPAPPPASSSRCSSNRNSTSCCGSDRSSSSASSSRRCNPRIDHPRKVWQTLPSTQ